ncbi:MAG: hypothetical protein OXH57_10850 [Ekhidna sp.]|nr:hypothetical protein [Ekhidna sp.]
MRQYIKNFLVVVFILLSIVGFGQEYDDLYFNKSSREKEKKKKVDVEIPRIFGQEKLIDTNQNNSRPTSFLGRQYDVQPLPEDLAAEKTISQESHDFYKPDKTIKDYTNSNFSTPGSTTQRGNNLSPNQNNPNVNFSDPINTVQNDPVIINNYYNAGWNIWGRPGWNAGLGWNNWGGSFWNAGFGWGGWYDPFWGPSLGWNAGWGWNNWGWGSAWCPPGFYNGFGGRRVALVSNDINRGRTVVKGPRNSRGGEVSSSGRIRTLETSSVASNRRSGSSRHQRDYLNKSRSLRYSNSVAGTNSQRSRSRNSTFNSGNSSRQSRNTLNQRSRNQSSNRSKSYNSSSGSRSRSSNSGTSGRLRSSGSSRSVNFSNSSRRSGAVRSSGSIRSRSSGSSRPSSGGSRNRSGSRRRD